MAPRQQLKSARLAAGLTYREVGTAAGLDGSSIAHFEAGRYRPSKAAAQRWQLALRELLAQRAKQTHQALEALK